MRSFHRIQNALVACLAIIVLSLSAPAQAQTTSNWNGTTGGWNAPARWSTNPFYPDNGNGAPTYKAIISGGIVDLNVDVTLTALELNGGALNGSGSMNSADFKLAGGSLGTTGPISFGHVALNSGVLARDLLLPVTSNSITEISIASGFTLTNPGGGTLTANVPGPGDKQSSGPGSFVNNGSFIKTGPNRYYLSIPTTNNGLIEVQQNNLRITETGTHSGAFSALAGTQLEFTGNQTLLPSTTVTGAGSLLLLSGKSTIDGEVSTSSLRLAGGTLAGSGNLHPGTFLLDSGVLARDLTLPVGSNTITEISVASGFTLTNPVGGTLTANVPGPGEKQSPGPGSFVNNGSFIKTGPNRFYLSMPTTNNGLIEVQQNNLRITEAGTHSGAFSALAGTQLEFAAAQTLLPSTTVTGAGSLLLLSGKSTIDGDLSTSSLRLAGGTLAGSGNLHPATFLLDSGVLARDLTLPVGSNTITEISVASGFTLTNPVGGTLTANVPGPGDKQSSGPGSFVNNGSFIKTGPNRYYLSIPTTNNGLIEVQQTNLRITEDGTHGGTFSALAGTQLEFAGNQTLLPTAKITGAGKLIVLQGTTSIHGNNLNDFSGGTTVFTGGRVVISDAGSALGSAQATIQSGGVVSLESVGNLNANQALVQAGGTLAVRSEFIPAAAIAPASAGTLGIDTIGFGLPVDLAVLGNGSMSLGSSTVGSYVANTLGPGAGATYRLGGGGGTLTLTQPNVLTGNRPLVIVGPGTVVLSAPQDFAGGVSIQSGTLGLGNAGALGVGPVLMQGGGLAAVGSPITVGNAITLGGNITLSGDQDLTFAANTKLIGSRTITVTNSGLTTFNANIIEDASGRALTKDGPGTLVLQSANLFSGGLTVRGGKVIVATSQHYQGNTSVTTGSTLDLHGDLNSTGSLIVSIGSVLQGEGKVTGATTIGANSILSPGASPGQFSFGAGLTLQNTSVFKWELGALTTSDPTNWDRLELTGGPLSVLSGAKLEVDFVGSASGPNSGAAFWNNTKRWGNVIDLGQFATNPTGAFQFLIDNSPWSQYGAFSTTLAQSGAGIDLVWTPVPEPATWVLALAGIATLYGVTKRRRLSR